MVVHPLQPHSCSLQRSRIVCTFLCLLVLISRSLFGHRNLVSLSTGPLKVLLFRLSRPFCFQMWCSAHSHVLLTLDFS